MKREDAYFEQGNGPASFSILHPPGASPDVQDSSLELDPGAAHDLRLDDLVGAFAANRAHQKEIRDLLSRLPRDPAVIAYRQAVLEDLLANPALAERFTALLPLVDSLADPSLRLEREMPWLHALAERAARLQNLIDCLESLGEALGAAEGSLQSEGLRRLQVEVRRAQDDPKYQSLVRELPELIARLRSQASITIGVNLDASLRPVQAVLLAVNEKPFTDQSLLNRLFGTRADQQGIAPLHSAPRQMPDRGGPVDPLMVPLFADLASVLEKTAIPIADRLHRYADMHGRLFSGIRRGLILYLGAIRFIGRCREVGLPMCRPEIAPADERRCEVTDTYNVHLALKHMQLDSADASIVRNTLRMGVDGRILILTGPNRGGKTTFTQAVGLVHVLAQLGCYVPGTHAVISPLDRLFTHFPLEEQPESNAGRFGEEAMRLAKIFERVTRHSLVLLNESLSSTSFGESLYLAQDIVRILRRVGARAIYSTHLHELARGVDALNASAPGDSRIVSVVSSPVDGDGTGGTRTYRLEVRPPLGQSYAREIAARYGISYEQLEELLSERGVL